MIRGTNRTRMIAALFAILFGLVCQALASEAGIDGKWKFEKTVVYGGGNSLEDSPPFIEFSIDDGKLIYRSRVQSDMCRKIIIFLRCSKGSVKRV